MRCGEHYGSGTTIFICLPPPRRAHAPTVAWFESHEVVFGPRGDEVISYPALLVKEFRGHHRTHGMGAAVFGAGGTAAVAIEPGNRVGTAGVERFAKDIEIRFAGHGAPR